MTLPQNYILCYFQIMDPQASPTAINLVLLMAGLVLIQTTVLIITLFLMRQQLESLNQKLQQLSDTTSHRFEFFHRILDVAETALGNLPDLEDVTKQKLETFTKTTQKIDQNVAQIISENWDIIKKFASGEDMTTRIAGMKFPKEGYNSK